MHSLHIKKNGDWVSHVWFKGKYIMFSVFVNHFQYVYKRYINQEAKCVSVRVYINFFHFLFHLATHSITPHSLPASLASTAAYYIFFINLPRHFSPCSLENCAILTMQLILICDVQKLIILLSWCVITGLNCNLYRIFWRDIIQCSFFIFFWRVRTLSKPFCSLEVVYYFSCSR